MSRTLGMRGMEAVQKLREGIHSGTDPPLVEGTERTSYQSYPKGSIEPKYYKF